jgi:hypothetical protein
MLAASDLMMGVTRMFFDVGGADDRCCAYFSSEWPFVGVLPTVAFVLLSVGHAPPARTMRHEQAIKTQATHHHHRRDTMP